MRRKIKTFKEKVFEINDKIRVVNESEFESKLFIEIKFKGKKDLDIKKQGFLVDNEEIALLKIKEFFEN